MTCKHVLDIWIKASLIEVLNKKYHFKIFCFLSRGCKYFLLYTAKCPTDLQPSSITYSSANCHSTVRSDHKKFMQFSWAVRRAMMLWMLDTLSRFCKQLYQNFNTCFQWFQIYGTPCGSKYAAFRLGESLKILLIIWFVSRGIRLTWQRDNRPYLNSFIYL
jgi:hypothetical protein